MDQVPEQHVLLQGEILLRPAGQFGAELLTGLFLLNLNSGLFNGCGQLLHGGRLQHKIHHLIGDSPLGVRKVRKPGEDNGPDMGPAAVQLPRQGEPVHPGHPYITHRNVRQYPGDLRRGILAVLRLGHHGAPQALPPDSVGVSASDKM